MGNPLKPDDPERVGSYTILGRIGEGGMGAVYLGSAPDGRKVAIKVVRPELAQDAGFVARFRDEVANAERVASFCTAQVLDHGESDGRAYMVTEYIDGVSLKDYVKENGELSPGMLQGVAVGVAAALVAIHSAGLIHRDLKPANVMLSFSGPRVIDFGIARALDVASGLTMTGQLVGSPGWMAPERILQHQVTTAVDIFSWGCLVAFARNGTNPFGTGDFSVMSARLVHSDPQVGALPAPLDRLVRAALEKDPRNRPTARELLLTMVGGESNEAAVLGTLTSWQSPVPLLPQGETRVMGDSTGERPGLSGPPQGNGVPVAYGPGSTPQQQQQAPQQQMRQGPPQHEPTMQAPPQEQMRQAQAPPHEQTRQAAPQRHDPTQVADGPGRQPSHGGPPTAYSGPPASYDRGPRGADPYASASATLAAGSRVESPTRPIDPGTRPPAGSPPGSSGDTSGGRGRGKVLLAGVAAVIVAAAAVTGWLVLSNRDNKDNGGTSTAAAGPAPLPSDALLVRIDRQTGWPAKCYGSIGKLAPKTRTTSSMLQDADKCDILPHWSPDHKRFAFTRSTGEGAAQSSALWVANADGSGAQLVSDQMAGRSRVAWSPDGSRVAMLTKVGTGRQIDVVTLSDKSLRQLTNDASQKDDPAWCGDRIAFWSNKTGTQQIYTVDAKTANSPMTPVTSLDHDVNDPAFSPDCTQMAYTDQPDKTQRHLWITTSDGKGPARQLTSDATRDMDATWSPNGKWIAFARGTTELPVVWAIRVSDKYEQQLSPDGKYMAHPDWAYAAKRG